MNTATLVTSVVLNFKKTTAGTVVYENKDTDTTIPTIYIKKAAFPSGEYPKSITLNVEA